MSAGGPAMKPLILWPFENSLQSRLVSIHLCSWTKLKDTQLWNMIMQEKCNVVGSQGSLSFKVERASSRKLSKVLPVSVFSSCWYCDLKKQKKNRIDLQSSQPSVSTENSPMLGKLAFVVQGSTFSRKLENILADNWTLESAAVCVSKVKVCLQRSLKHYKVNKARQQHHALNTTVSLKSKPCGVWPPQIAHFSYRASHWQGAISC